MNEAASRRIVSLLSGTSADGIDVGLVRVSGSGRAARLELEWFETIPFPAGMTRRIHAASRRDAYELARLDARLGDLFADAAELGCRVARERELRVDAVATHGQTIVHLPEPEGEDPPATLQLGQADRIAERVGLPIVSDFRQRDLAAGGQGAPLVPYLDHVLFARDGEVWVPVNLGGILNLTVVVEDPRRIRAFDVGPANSILDELVRQETGGEEVCDRGGRRALRGASRADVVSRILDHSYFARRPPKSTGLEEFGEEFVLGLRRGSPGIPLEDLLASAVEAIGAAFGRALREIVVPGVGACHGVVLSGGGVHNRALVAALERGADPVPVHTSAEHGVDPDAKECLLFALLAQEALEGVPASIPSATGADRAVVLGKISPGPGRLARVPGAM